MAFVLQVGSSGRVVGKPQACSLSSRLARHQSSPGQPRVSVLPYVWVVQPRAHLGPCRALDGSCGFSRPLTLGGPETSSHGPARLAGNHVTMTTATTTTHESCLSGQGLCPSKAVLTKPGHRPTEMSMSSPIVSARARLPMRQSEP